MSRKLSKKKPRINLEDAPIEPWDDTAEYLRDGLNDEEVRERLEKGKVNGEQTVRTKSVARIFIGNICTFFNFVFIALAVLLMFFVDFNASGLGNFGFMVLVIVNATMGIVQELRAKKTMDKLSLISAPRVKVIRKGEQSEVAVKDVLLNDLTVLSCGDQICADAEVVEGSIEVNESMITGEPDAIAKHAGDRVMSGSCVVSGKAKARVVHIGADNFAMKISAGAKYFKKPNSEIWRSLMLFVKIMAVIIVPLGCALFGVKYFLHGGDMRETVVTTVGSLVGMIPSGLAALSSAVFCISVIRLAKYKTLAQDMYCVETLARVDVLCLDKTGTITSGAMEVNGIRSRRGLTDEEFKVMLKNILSASQDENATAMAIRKYLEGIEPTQHATQTVPFSSARKWSGAVIDGRSYVLGAPEFILDMTTDTIRQTCNKMAEEGLRVLAVASSPKPFGEKNVLPSKLRQEGLIFLTDTVRKEAPETLEFFRKQGVALKVISGDNPVTVRSVAQRAGLTDCEHYVDMSTLPKDIDYKKIAEENTIFGRVLPDQKLALVKALKECGHTVAMTGDGVNDVLALKESDCSIAMASGSDAAKNVSSLVLLDSNFASLPKVVAEGRRSINNLERSASLYLVKTIYNFLLALIFLLVDSALPFAPKQLTLIGMVTIGLPSFALALEPNTERVRGRFLPKVLCNALPGAIMVVVGVLMVLAVKKYFLPDIPEEQMQTMYVIVTTFVGFIYLFRICLPLTPLHILLWVGCIALFVASYIVKVPFFDLQEFFGLSDVFTADMMKYMAIMALILLPWFTIVLRLTEYLRAALEKKHRTKLKAKQSAPPRADGTDAATASV